jgi:hypothetical protein
MVVSFWAAIERAAAAEIAMFVDHGRLLSP